jgi:hypothetical protein
VGIAVRFKASALPLLIVQYALVLSSQRSNPSELNRSLCPPETKGKHPELFICIFCEKMSGFSGGQRTGNISGFFFQFSLGKRRPWKRENLVLAHFSAGFFFSISGVKGEIEFSRTMNRSSNDRRVRLFQNRLNLETRKAIQDEIWSATAQLPAAWKIEYP